VQEDNVAGQQNYYSSPVGVEVNNPHNFAPIFSKFLTGMIVTEANSPIDFFVLLTVHFSIFILVITQLDA